MNEHSADNELSGARVAPESGRAAGDPRPSRSLGSSDRGVARGLRTTSVEWRRVALRAACPGAAPRRRLGDPLPGRHLRSGGIPASRTSAGPGRRPFCHDDRADFRLRGVLPPAAVAGAGRASGAPGADQPARDRPRLPGAGRARAPGLQHAPGGSFIPLLYCHL